jgi:YggT family protein|tara:strand:- start:87 stop:347 length:261 start_codon:yes stop_codon:yes gene_type:complete
MNPYIAQATMTFLEILTWTIIARALISWLPIDQSSPIVQLLHSITEPIISPIRRILPNTGMMDLSPLATILAMMAFQQIFSELATM